MVLTARSFYAREVRNKTNFFTQIIGMKKLQTELLWIDKITLKVI